MKKTIVSKGILALAAGCALSTTAMAGGLDRGGYNVDLLFDQGRFAAESAATFVAPQRKLKNVRDINPANNLSGGGNLNRFPDSVNDTENYWVPRVGLKAGIGDSADCMFDYSQPWGVHTNPGRQWAGANENIETRVESDNYALTCSYSFDVGPGQLRMIGGAFYQELSGFKERQVLDEPVSRFSGGGNGVGRLDLEGDGWGWRAGVAYEIPEYALRASLVYNSEVKLDDITGILDLSALPAVPGTPGGLIVPVKGAQDMPDVLELKVQSGIAPDWLAFGSVKWTDWSQLQKIRFCPAVTPGSCNASNSLTSLDLGYRDGWTVSGGIGHKFTEQWSGAVTVTWDRGTSQGFGTQTDTWTFGAGASYTPTENVEFRLAGALGVLTSGSSGTVTRDGEVYGERISYDFDNDLVAAVSTSLKVRF